MGDIAPYGKPCTRGNYRAVYTVDLRLGGTVGNYKTAAIGYDALSS